MSGQLTFASLAVVVPVLGNFTIERALNWSYSTQLLAFTTSVVVNGHLEFALTQRATADTPSSSVATLRPMVNGSLNLESIKLPGPGFSGTYTWSGELAITPDPLAAWSAVLVHGSNGSSDPLRRGRRLAQEVGGSTAAAAPLVVYVQGPVHVAEYDTAGVVVVPAGGGVAAGFLLDPDGSVQVVGEVPPAALFGTSSLTPPSQNSSTAAAASSRLSRQKIIIIVATVVGGPAAAALCVLFVLAALLRLRREEQSERPPALAAGVPAAPDTSHGAESPAPSLLPPEAWMAGGSVATSSGVATSVRARLSGVLNTLGFGFQRGGTLPGARGERYSVAGANAGGGTGNSAGLAGTSPAALDGSGVLSASFRPERQRASFGADLGLLGTLADIWANRASNPGGRQQAAWQPEAADGSRPRAMQPPAGDGHSEASSQPATHTVRNGASFLPQWLRGSHRTGGDSGAAAATLAKAPHVSSSNPLYKKSSVDAGESAPVGAAAADGGAHPTPAFDDCAGAAGTSGGRSFGLWPAGPQLDRLSGSSANSADDEGAEFVSGWGVHQLGGTCGFKAQ